METRHITLCIWRLGLYLAGDVLNYAFLASRLQFVALQTKLLQHVGIVASGSTFDDALEDHTSDWLRVVLISGLGQAMNGISAGIEVDIGLGGGCVKALRPTGMADFVPARAMIDAALRKRGRYMAKCAAIGYGFLPFSFSSLGELEAGAVGWKHEYVDLIGFLLSWGCVVGVLKWVGWKQEYVDLIGFLLSWGCVVGVLKWVSFLAPEAVELFKRVQRVTNSSVMTPSSTNVIFQMICFAIYKNGFHLCPVFFTSFDGIGKEGDMKAWIISDSLVNGWILDSLSEKAAIRVVNSIYGPSVLRHTGMSLLC
uniref:Ankyrin repeat-containing domain, PGG domain protein n=1 Tax=Tanacetum cinerariifolium TaxID=118510 RepID=A0A699IB40_TANCI|nr:ankyrin repeat-containing domain, PGG domain protein [Tanacetum cinerariifolium]